MWEDATVAVGLLGFVGAIALVLTELPIVLARARQIIKRHR